MLSGTLLKMQAAEVYIRAALFMRCTIYIYFLRIKYKYKSIYLFIAKTLFCNELEVIWTVDSTEITPKKQNCNEHDNKIVLLLRTHCERLFLLGYKYDVHIKNR